MKSSRSVEKPVSPSGEEDDRLKWTTKKPTTSGWYGYRGPLGEAESFIVLIVIFSLLLAAGSLAINGQPGLASPEQTQATPAQVASALRIINASDWKGGVESSEGECGATTGEYSYWVYATATRCGVPREQAERVVSIRQPIPGMAPLSARAELPEGRYAVWVYGSGQPGHPWVILCGKSCAYGELPPTPAWAMIGWVDLRDNQGLLFRTYRQPDGHRLDVYAVVLSSSETPPDWKP